MPKRTKRKKCKSQAGGANGKGKRKAKRFFKGLNKGLKQTKAISKGSAILDTFGVPYAGKTSQVAKQLGYGKVKRNKYGGYVSAYDVQSGGCGTCCKRKMIH